MRHDATLVDHNENFSNNQKIFEAKGIPLAKIFKISYSFQIVWEAIVLIHKYNRESILI